MGIEERIKNGLGRLRGFAGPGLPIDGTPARVRDAKGKVLELGDEVLVVAPTQEFRIAAIQPLVAPGAPPNLMQVMLVTKLMIVVPRDQGVESVYQLRHAAAITDNPLAAASEPPPVPDEPKVVL